MDFRGVRVLNAFPTVDHVELTWTSILNELPQRPLKHLGWRGSGGSESKRFLQWVRSSGRQFEKLEVVLKDDQAEKLFESLGSDELLKRASSFEFHVEQAEPFGPAILRALENARENVTTITLVSEAFTFSATRSKGKSVDVMLGTVGPHQLMKVLPELAPFRINRLDIESLKWSQDYSDWTKRLDAAIEKLPLLGEIVFPEEWNVT